MHRLSGFPPDKGTPIAVSGETDIPPDVWTPVTVWIPRGDIAFAETESRLVRIEGLGLAYPGPDLQGLNGNRPGDGYAIRAVTPIFYEPPELTEAEDGATPRAYLVHDAGTGAALGEFSELAALRTGLRQRVESSPAGVNRVSVRVAGDARMESGELAWIRLPPKPAVACRWHETRPDTLCLQGESAYPDPRFAAAAATVGGQPVAWESEGFSRRVAPVPRQEPFCVDRIPVEVAFAASTARFDAVWREAPVRAPPALLALEGAVPLLNNGEAGPDDAMVSANPNRMRRVPGDPVQGWYYTARNTEREKRLQSAIPVSVPLARFPILQFRYRTRDPLARVSLSIGHGRLAAVSESFGSAIPVRYAPPFVADGAWHTWVGLNYLPI